MPKIIWSNFSGMSSTSVYDNSKLAPDDAFQSATAVDTIKTPGVLRVGIGAGTDFTNISGIRTPMIKVVNYFAGASFPDLFGFGIEAGTTVYDARVHKLDLVTDTFANTGGWPYTIGGNLTTGHVGHTHFVGEDVTMFKENGVTKLMAAWTDGTDGDLFVSTLDLATKSDTYFADNSPGHVALGRFPHPIVRGDNGYYYVADGPSIHKIDGSTAPATITLSAIDLPTGWIIYDMLNFKGLCWILARQQFNYIPNDPTGNAAFETAVFQWNYVSNRAADFSGFTAGSPFFLENSAEGSAANIGKLFLLLNVVHTMTYTISGRTQIRRFSGAEFVPAAEIAGNYLPARGGLTGYKGQVAWLAITTGTFCTYGSISPDYPPRYNFIGKLPSTSNTSAGFLSIDYSGNYYGCYQDTKVGLLNGMATSASLTTFVKEMPKLSRVKNASILYRPITDVTASTLTFTFYKNYSTTAVAGTFQLTHAKDGASGLKFFELSGKNFQNANAMRWTATWALHANAVDAIEPYRIEMEYDQLVKKK
jgi:hypothetical protein